MPSTCRRRAAAPVTLAVLIALCLASGRTLHAQPAADADPGVQLAHAIEQAHGLDAWRDRAAVQFDLSGRFGDQPFNAHFLYEIGSTRTRMLLPDGTKVVWDGEQAWVSPASMEPDRLRFHLRTWPYFLAAPFKLRDPGSQLEFLGRLPAQPDQPMPAARLTFAEGVGDSPDDWYIAYRDPETDRLAALAYIVTYGTPAEQAEQNPHAVLYRGWRTLDGVTLSTDWRFHHWSEDQGAHGQMIGHVTLSELAFVDPPEDVFDKPEDARALPLPGE